MVHARTLSKVGVRLVKWCNGQSAYLVIVKTCVQYFSIAKKKKRKKEKEKQEPCHTANHHSNLKIKWICASGISS
jgi:hypothetical protein